MVANSRSKGVCSFCGPFSYRVAQSAKGREWLAIGSWLIPAMTIDRVPNGTPRMTRESAILLFRFHSPERISLPRDIFPVPPKRRTAECLPMKTTLGLLVLLWFACGLVAEARAIDDRPLKLHNVALGPVALGRELGWI